MRALIWGFKMLAKLSAEPLLSQSCQEEVLYPSCTHGNLFEQNMFSAKTPSFPSPSPYSFQEE